MHLACVSCGFDPQWDPLPPPPQDNISSSDKIAQESVLELLKDSDSHGKPGDQPHQGTCVSVFLTSSQGILRVQAHCPRNTKGTGRCVCWGGGRVNIHQTPDIASLLFPYYILSITMKNATKGEENRGQGQSQGSESPLHLPVLRSPPHTP